MIEAQQTKVRRDEVLAEFEGKKYLRLETYRRNGKPVQTTVWFVADSPLLYIRTSGKSGKAQRIRRNSHVRIVPFKPSGKPDGEWLEAEARISKDLGLERIDRMMSAKYNLMDKLLARLYRFLKRRQQSDMVISILAKK